MKRSTEHMLNGFGGESGLSGPPGDLAEFPDYMARVLGDLDFEMPACVGPVSHGARIASALLW